MYPNSHDSWAGWQVAQNLYLSDVKQTVLEFIRSHATVYDLPMPGASRGRAEVAPVYLPSSNTFISIHADYIKVQGLEWRLAWNYCYSATCGMLMSCISSSCGKNNFLKFFTQRVVFALCGPNSCSLVSVLISIILYMKEISCLCACCACFVLSQYDRTAVNKNTKIFI